MPARALPVSSTQARPRQRVKASWWRNKRDSEFAAENSVDPNDKNWLAVLPDWNWSDWSDWKIPEFNQVQESVIDFNVNRLADVLEMSAKTLKQSR